MEERGPEHASWERRCEYLHRLLQEHRLLEPLRARPQVHASSTTLWGVLSAQGRRVSSETIRGPWWDMQKRSEAQELADRLAAELYEVWTGKPAPEASPTGEAGVQSPEAVGRTPELR